jgi:hypothetical protein
MMPGSAIVPPVVRQRLPDLSGTAAKLAIALSGYVNAKTGDAFPSNQTLMRDAGITDWRTFRDARKELAGCGLTWVTGLGARRTTYRWSRVSVKNAEGVSVKNTESVILGDCKKPSGGICNLTPQVTVNREQPISRDASHAGAKAKRRASTKATGPNVWGWWVDANRDAGQPDPVRIGPDLKAGQALGKLVASEELTETEVRECMTLYLGDTDAWLARQGHALRHLAGRLNAYRNRAREQDPPPLDADLVDEIETRAEKGQR